MKKLAILEENTHVNMVVQPHGGTNVGLNRGWGNNVWLSE